MLTRQQGVGSRTRPSASCARTTQQSTSKSSTASSSMSSWSYVGRATAASSVADGLAQCQAFHHFEDVPFMIRGLETRLKPGGSLIVVDFDSRTGMMSRAETHGKPDAMKEHNEVSVCNGACRLHLLVMSLPLSSALCRLHAGRAQEADRPEWQMVQDLGRRLAQLGLARDALMGWRDEVRRRFLKRLTER